MTSETIARAIEELGILDAKSLEDETTCLTENARVKSFVLRLAEVTISVGPAMVLASLFSAIVIGYKIGRKVQEIESEVNSLEKFFGVEK